MPHNTANTTVTTFNMLDSLGYFLFARHYSGNHYCFLFLRLLRCFSSPGQLHISYLFRYGYADITQHGLPHSEICGFQVISTLPQHIVGSHVLHRQLVPRHPPYALSNLTKNLLKDGISFNIKIVCFCRYSNDLKITYSFNLSKN